MNVWTVFSSAGEVVCQLHGDESFVLLNLHEDQL